MTAPQKNFTPQQTAAITGRGNLLVAAGAGTGKTRTLVGRCLRLIVEERVSLENILMVTFTEAAAAEMRARIRQELRAAQAANPGDAQLAQQLALLDTARICTLHSFCLQLAREHFHALGLDPQFTVLDEQQTRPLLSATLDELLERHYSHADAAARAVQALIRAVGRGADGRIRRLVRKIHDRAQSLPDPAGWLDEQQRRFESAEPAEWRAWFLEAVAAWRDDWQDGLRDAAGEASAVKLCFDAFKNVPARLSPADAAGLLRCVMKADADAVNWPRGTKGRVRDPLEKFFNEAEFLASLLPGDDGVDPLAQDWEWTRHHMATLLSLAREFTVRFRRARRELGGVDFADLEQCALQLLRDPAIAAQWRARLAHVFVDEYQDINEAQDRIITALSRGGAEANRFLVGDVKQSIYRFRLANPKIFSGYDALWSSGADGRRIPLTENFRSRAALLDFINPLFAALMREAVGGVAYEPLVFGAPDERRALARGPGDPPAAELHVIARDDDDAASEETPEENGAAKPATDLLAVEREARLLARRLRELKDGAQPVWDEREKNFRPARWSDMAVLLRSPSGRAEAFAMEFSKAGVPLVAARDGFFESLEVSDLINLLKLLDNPLQDIPLLAVLRSPLVGMSLDELAEIRGHSPLKPFWTALMVFHRELRKNLSPTQSPPPSLPSEAGGEGRGEEEPAGSSNDPQAPLTPALSPLDRGERETETSSAAGAVSSSAWTKADLFLRQFTRWRERVRQGSLSICLETALADTHFEALLEAGSRGGERAANVRRLLDLARQFDPYQRQGLYRFLRFVAAQEEEELDLQPALPPTADAVRLMSVHRSKGLEFPIVALAGLGTRFNEQDLNEPVLLSEAFGLCPKITPPDSEQSYPGLPHWLARRGERRELSGEELRLLYVALTRARDALVLVGTANRKAAGVKWETRAGQAITTGEVANARSHLDWLLAWLPAATRDADWRDERGGENSFLRWRIYEPDDAMFAGAPARDPAEVPVAETNVAEDARSLERVKAAVAWQYPFLAATRETAKTTVSVLRRRQRDETDDETRPLFPFHPTRRRRAAGGLSAAQIGSAHHSFLQFAALGTLGAAADLRNEAERLRAENKLTAEELAALDFDALAGFARSAIGKKFLAQPRGAIHREIPFTARFSASDLAAAGLPLDFPGDEFVVVQGVADLAVILPEEIWLVDFKTDDLKPEELAERAKQYAPQLKLYALALSRIYGRRVTECHLYFLATRSAVRIEPAGESAYSPRSGN